MKQPQHAGRLCAAGNVDPIRRMAARRAILNHSQTRDCTLYRPDEDDPDAEEVDLGDARILFVGTFQPPPTWDESTCVEYFADAAPELFRTAFIECTAATDSTGFFLAEVGDYVASMTNLGQVEMFFVHDCREDDDGRLCVLILDDEPI